MFMTDIKITFETLFDLVRREKNRQELQKLDKDFYQQVISYISEKKHALFKKQGELFMSREKERQKVQFQNIRRLIKDLYERREKKIIHMALSKARTGSDVIDTSPLLSSEREFFEEQVVLFSKYKKQVLLKIINASEAPAPKVTEEKKEPEVKEDSSLKKIKIITDLPKFMGKKGNVLGPYKSGEEVEVDEAVASLLVKKEKAQYLS
jgi:DNA replication initiation complex subunit (GINS family)